MFGPRHTHEQTPQYYANGAPVIACCFIIKGNLGCNGIHSVLCIVPPTARSQQTGSPLQQQTLLSPRKQNITQDETAAGRQIKTRLS